MTNPTNLLPLDLETVAIEYLSGRADLLELLGGDAELVSGKLRRGWTKGDLAVRIVRVGGTPVDHVGHLDRARLQVEAFAGDDLAAHDLAARALVELRTLEGRKVEVGAARGVVTAVEQDLGLRRQPDPITDAPRYLFGVVLYGHPTAS